MFSRRQGAVAEQESPAFPCSAAAVSAVFWSSKALIQNKKALPFPAVLPLSHGSRCRSHAASCCPHLELGQGDFAVAVGVHRLVLPLLLVLGAKRGAVLERKKSPAFSLVVLPHGRKALL